MFDKIHKKDTEKTKSNENNSVRKLAKLDDSHAILILHALCCLLYKDPMIKTFRNPISLGHIPKQTLEEFFEEKRKNKFYNNPYCKATTSFPRKELKKLKYIVIGFHGSSLYGEWLNAYVTKKEDLYHQHEFLETHILTMLLAKILEIVPSDIFDKIHQQNKKVGLLVNIKQNSQKEYIRFKENKTRQRHTIYIKYNKKTLNSLFTTIPEMEKRMRFDDLLTEMKPLKNLHEEFLYSWRCEHEKSWSEIEKFSQVYDLSNFKMDFIKTIQFCTICSTFLKLENMYFYYPPLSQSNNESESQENTESEIPQLFFILFGGNIDRTNLSFFDSIHEGFIKQYQRYVDKQFKNNQVFFDKLDEKIRVVKVEDVKETVGELAK